MSKKKQVAVEEPVEQQIKNLAKGIKELRKEKGFKNYEFFAYEHKIGRSQYGKYEQGVDMQWSSIVKLIKKHGMTVKEFFSEGFD